MYFFTTKAVDFRLANTLCFFLLYAFGTGHLIAVRFEKLVAAGA